MIILALNFILPRLMPGDPLQAIYGNEAIVAMSPELEAEIRRRFSLDQSYWQQFLAYMFSLCRGDLGYSYYYNAPVQQVIMSYLPWTVLLTGTALLFSTLLGAFLGIESGYRQNSALDRFFLGGLMMLNGFPDFFVGIVLLFFFGVTLGIAPLAGALSPYSGTDAAGVFKDVLHHLVLPLASLILVRTTSTFLLTRNVTVTTLGESFILTARAKGCSDPVVRYHHVGRSSLITIATSAGIQLSRLFSGVVFIEVVFSYPGLGLLLYNSLLTRDYPLLQGILLLITILVLAVNLTLDLLYQKIDPRVSYAH